MKALMTTILTLFFTLNTFAIVTPQKYCQSLAATSCEVLDYEFNVGGAGYGNTSNERFGAPYLHIKYCRDQLFKSMTYTINHTNSTGRLNHNYTSGKKYYVYTSTGHYVMIDMTTICTQVDSNSDLVLP